MYKSRNQGFTVIELVIVIVILGLLAATAIPRFLNVTEEAEDASAEGMAGGLATAVSFVRSQWEVDGRRNDEVTLDGTRIGLDTRFGFPTGTEANTDASAMDVNSCQAVFDRVLQNAPRNVVQGESAKGERIYITVQENGGGSVTGLDGTAVTVDLCRYHLVNSLTLSEATGIPAPQNPGTTTGKGFTYNPGSGQVLVFKN
ncbi:prepilin-type N-terminal cleavage/methylation domain-containing protein [Paraferrimonas haliotis]|uniref:MSHA biogenesis protein MshB n=1 Tax=Paraferrimonas haliotis TaxID=2013866 RepID=A0AA37TSK1_9GAMM|nr:prepilin-type N-terminal cleavage/methylation domain-containing protein [Paraferrimonas haliotis]GLS82344.1 MSHA biogenesis protein MshB [Paraferrimonas haliotis]